MSAQARGLRNNNPLNIRRGEKWQGLKAKQEDKSFAQFISIEWGIRAAFCVLKTYMNKYGYQNVASIIKRWAPPTENNTEKYISTVYAKSGIPPYNKINFANKTEMCKLVQAMAYVETGCMIDMKTIEKGYAIL